MLKKLLCTAIAAGTLALTGCASDGASAGGATSEGGADVFGTKIYLRGEMNDWNAQSQYLIQKVSDGLYVVKNVDLKVDWAPYKFKFADAAWTSGTNFGYKEQPGVFEWGGAPIVLNPKSVFEEVKVTPPADGLYDFYFDVTDPENPATYVKEAGK